MAAVFKREQGITVSYPVREQEQTISHADYYAARTLGEANKVKAIKFIRMQTGLGLYESKQIVDTILANSDVLTSDDLTRFYQQPSAAGLGALLRNKCGSGFDN